MPVNIDQKSLEQFSRLELLARQIVEGFITGLHKSPFHGFSVEFAEHRLYNTGESTRHIDWKLFARTNKFFVKRYEEETNLRCRLVIDCSGSMHYPVEAKNQYPGKLNKLGFSCYSAAALITLLKQQLDAFGLTLFSNTITLNTPAKSSVSHQKYIYDELENLLGDTAIPKPGNATVIAKQLHTLAETMHKRSLLILFSDMFDNKHQLEEIFSALQHLRHNKHEVLIFHTVDKSTEMDFRFENRPYTFVDLESGEEVKIHASAIKESYIENTTTFLKELSIRCLAHKIDLVEADINEGFDKVLYNYFIKRAALSLR